MIDPIEYLESLQGDKFLFLSVLYTASLIASTIDFTFGWVNAKFNKNVRFESGIALYGIIKKMQYFIVMLFFMFIAFLLVPSTVAFPALVALFVGYLFSEVNSILSHLELTEDGKTGELFITFVKRIFTKNFK